MENTKILLTHFEAWGQSHSALVERWRFILADLKSSSALNYTMFFVAIRELLDLTQTTIQTHAQLDVVMEK